MITRKDVVWRLDNGESFTQDELSYIIDKNLTTTHSEFKKVLLSCPEWVEADRQRREAHQRSVERLRFEMNPEMKPLLADLRAANYEFDSLSDFVNTSASYPDAIPVFLEHLQKVSHPVIRNMIGRSLTVIEARGIAGPIIVEEMRQNKDEGEQRWVMANALAYVATKEDVEGMKEVLSKESDEWVKKRLRTAIKNARNR